MKNSKRLTVCSLMIIAISACVTLPTTPARITDTPFPTNTPEPYPLWLVTLLNAPVCQPPCWEEITPGVTTREQAKNLMSNVPDVSITEQEIVPYGTTLKWQRGTIMFNSEDYVEEIQLRVLGLNLPVETLLSKFGDPSKIVISDWYGGIITADLVYLSNGLVISLFVEDLGSHPDNIQIDIDANQDVADIYFFMPGLVFYYSNIRSDFKTFDWNGYIIYQ